jgi:hypothetical protein
MITKKPENSGKKQVRDKKGRWLPGVSGNPKGKPTGRRNFGTDFDLALEEVAEALRLGRNPDKVKIEIVKKGILEALKGKYPFWKEIMERYYGKITEKVEMDTKIEEIKKIEEALRELAEND